MENSATKYNGLFQEFFENRNFDKSNQFKPIKPNRTIILGETTGTLQKPGLQIQLFKTI